MPVAVGYIRKSSIKEGERTYSIQTQHEAIERVCGEYDYTLSRVYQDAAEGMNFSGMYENNRPDWLQMQADIARGGIDAVVVYAIDRLSRNTEHMLKFISLLKKHNVALLSYREPGLEFESAAGELQVAIMAAVGSFEARRGSERVRAMIRKRQSDGYVWGFLPFGYDRDENGMLVPNSDADTVRLIVDKFINGASLRDIEDYARINNLTISSSVTGYTKNLLAKTSIHGILCNHWLYRGFITPGVRVVEVPELRHLHDETNPPPQITRSEKIMPILSEAQAVATAEALRRRSKSGPRAKSGTHRGLLVGIIFCKHCQKRMHMEVTKRPSGPGYYYYYSHNKRACPARFCTIPRDVVESAVIDRLSSIAITEDQLSAVKAQLSERESHHASSVIDLERQKSRIREAARKLNKMFQWGTIEDSEYIAERQKLDVELAALTKQTTNSDVYDIDAMALEIKRLSENLSTALDFETKRAIIMDVIERVEVEKTEDGWRIHLTPTPAWVSFWLDLIDRERQA